MIKKILDEDIELAIKFCFDVYVDSTSFRRFKRNYDVALENYIDIALKYRKENKTIYYGYYIDNDLVGVIELNGSYINQLVVKKEYQHNKIGTKLIEFVLKKLDTVEVDAYTLSIPFYKKLGFVLKNEREEQKNSVKMVKVKK